MLAVLVISPFSADWSFGREPLEEQTPLVILVSWSLFPTSDGKTVLGVVLYSQDHLH